MVLIILVLKHSFQLDRIKRHLCSGQVLIKVIRFKQNAWYLFLNKNNNGFNPTIKWFATMERRLSCANSSRLLPTRQHQCLIYAANINQLVCGQQTALMVVWLAVNREGEWRKRAKHPQRRASTPSKDQRVGPVGLDRVYRIVASQRQQANPIIEFIINASPRSHPRVPRMRGGGFINNATKSQAGTAVTKHTFRRAECLCHMQHNTIKTLLGFN